MRITDVTNSIKVSDLKKKKNSTASEGVFSGMLESEEAAEVTDTEVSLTVGSVISADLLSTLNGGQDETFNNKLNVEWGRDILQDLTQLRNQILIDKISENALHRVEEKLNNIPLKSGDDNLKNIVEEIRTRAAVELAKLEKFKK